MIDMIKVIINGTGKLETLSITGSNGIDFVKDFIGNYGAFSDGQFTYNDAQNAYECEQDTFDWWSKVLADHQELEDRIAELKEEHGSERVQEVLGQVGSYDLEDMASAINKELDESFVVHSGN